MKKQFILGGVALSVLLSSCAVVRPGEVGIKQTLGEFSDNIKERGPLFYNPFVSKVIKESTQTI